jgi:hypothetical protein
MKNILRIILEVIIISFLVIFINHSLSQERKSEITRGTELIGVTKPVWLAKELPDVASYKVFHAIGAAGYFSGNYLFPIMGYDLKNKKLTPLSMYLKYPLGKESIPSAELAPIFAGYRDSITSSYNDLEQRITKLENKVAQIEKECCPKK